MARPGRATLAKRAREHARMEKNAGKRARRETRKAEKAERLPGGIDPASVGATEAPLEIGEADERTVEGCDL